VPKVGISSATLYEILNHIGYYLSSYTGKQHSVCGLLYLFYTQQMEYEYL